MPTKRTPSLILLLALISALPLVAKAQYGSIPRRYTRRLPTIDKVELQKLKPGDYGFKGVEKSKTVEGADAQKIASLWRAQNFHQMAAVCHEPVFGLKFFLKDKTIMHVSICWECNNIVVVEPTLKSNATQGFAGASKAGQKLLEEFKRTFP